jgi:hypothetical protein
MYANQQEDGEGDHDRSGSDADDSQATHCPLVTGPMCAEAVSAASLAVRTALIESASGAELSHHPGHRSAATKPEDADKHRSVTSGKTVPTQHDPLLTE